MVQAVAFIGQGVSLTLALVVGGLFIGLSLAVLASIVRQRQQSVARAISFMISLLRGTPLILQLAFIYFSVPTLFGIRLNILTAGILTFGLNSFAYITEILRSGIESLPKGQFEAAKTLQIPSYYMWKDIVLPQVIRNILPAMINEVITLLKETALISTIGGLDIMRSAQVLAAQQFTYFMPLCIAGGYYYALVLMIEYGGRKLAQRMVYA